MIRTLAPSRWSLRTRLVAVVVVLVAVALAVTGTLGVTLLRSYLDNQIDQQLTTLGSRSPGATGVPRGQPPQRPSDATAQNLPTPFIFTVLSPQGSVVFQAGGATGSGGPRPDLSGLNATTIAQHGTSAFTVPAIGGSWTYRVRIVKNDDGTSTAIALSLRGADATIRRMELITLLVALVVLAVLAASAAWMVRLGLRPLRAIEQTAKQTAEGDLSRRVPSARPHTEIGRLSFALNVMLGQIESAFADRERSAMTLRQFIADASHELRTPLTTVRGYAELVNRDALEDDAQRRHALERIEAEATRMGGLVEDLLLLAYLDQQRPLESVRTDLAVLVTDAVADARARDPQRPIECAIPDDPVWVEVDIDRMRQVLTNLLSNALTHTPPATPIEVALAEAAGRARVTVADHGPGIAPAELNRLFERFYRGDPSRSRARGGSGLGLSIVAAVVAASRGTVECVSTLGQGSTFTVALPLTVDQHHPPRAMPDSGSVRRPDSIPVPTPAVQPVHS
jgi:two-component system OmpR family sensor kinase